MKLRDLLFVLAGVILCLLGVRIYNSLKPQPAHYYSDQIRLVNLNDEISQQRSNAIVLAANKVSPAVVSITVIQTRVVASSPFFSPFTDEFFNDFFRDFFPEHYYKQQIKSLGTGIIISSDGYILTNEHVISNATDIHITLPDGRQFKGEVVVSDVMSDLALLKVDAKNLPFAELGDSDDLMIGEWVIALGNPFGFLLEDTRPTVTVGVISALNRAIKSTRDDRFYKNMIQTDAAINPGNSGGPLVNILGQVIGINTFIFTSGGGSEGIGFARPINVAKKFVAEAKAFGKVRKPWIGLWVQNITDEIARAMEIDRKGILVSGIDADSPAERAGIKEGDRVVSVNGHTIHKVADWDRFIANVFVGDTIKLRLMREGDSLNVDFVVEELKELEGTRIKYGIYVEDINPRLIKKYKLRYKDGVVVTKVEKNSIGEKLGIKPGDVILGVGKKRIRDKDDFKYALKNLHDSYFIIDRGGFIIQLYFGL